MLSRILTIGFTIGILTSLTGSAFSQSPTTPASPNAGSEVAPVNPLPKARPLPFQGKVDRVNKAAGTFTIKTKEGKEHIYHITPDTKIEKADGPATIDDIKRDEIVRGSRIKLADYKWQAKKVIIGAKEPGEEGSRRKRK